MLYTVFDGFISNSGNFLFLFIFLIKKTHLEKLLLPQIAFVFFQTFPEFYSHCSHKPTVADFKKVEI